MSDLVKWFAEADGFEQGAKAPHKWVLQAEQELRIQAARIEELEAENARLRLVAHYARDVADAAIENTREAEAKLATARNDALEEAAAINDRWKSYAQDGETFDDAMDRLSRTIRAMKSTNQT